MQEAKDRLLDRLIVKFSGRVDLTRKQRALPAGLERPEVFAIGFLVDPEEAAHRASAQPMAAPENRHGPITVRQTPVVKAVKQGRDVGKIADFPTKRIQADLLLDEARIQSNAACRACSRLSGFGARLMLGRHRGKSAPYGSRNDRWVGAR